MPGLPSEELSYVVGGLVVLAGMAVAVATRGAGAPTDCLGRRGGLTGGSVSARAGGHPSGSSRTSGGASSDSGSR